MVECASVEAQTPRVTSARGLHLWDQGAARVSVDGVQAVLGGDMANQSPPDDPEGNCTNW